MNRLVELEAALLKERERHLKGKGSASGTPGQAVYPQGLARYLRRRGVRSRALDLPVNYTVPGIVPVTAQPTGNACWATVFTMLYSWKEGQSIRIEDALAQVGERWVRIFQADTGLSSGDKVGFVAAAGLVAEPPMNPSVEGWERMLRDYGPIWVTTDEAPGLPWAIHARVITAIRGDGTPSGTQFTIIDPAGGRQYTESIATFMPKYEEEVLRTGHTRIQILHWPRDARFGAAKALRMQRSNGRLGLSRMRSGLVSGYSGGSALVDPTSGPAIQETVARLRSQGVAQAQIDAFLQQLRGGGLAETKSYHLVRPLGGDQLEVHLPTGHVLEGWQAALLLAAIPAGPIKLLIPAIQALCNRFNVTVGIGPAVTAGFAAGVGGGVGLLIAPGNRIGFYGTLSGVVGAIVSISATMQVTVVHGGPSVFGGTAVAVGVTGDLDVGITGGAHALLSNGRFIGVTAEIGVSAGLSPIEVMAQFQYTATSMGYPAYSPALGWGMGIDPVQWNQAMTGDIPLDPGAGGMSIGVDGLQEGDILLSTTSDWISRAIRSATNSQVSHAALYVGNGNVVEAVGQGVQLKPLEEAMVDDTFTVAFRYPGLTDGQRRQIVDFAASKVGQSYDRWGIVRQALFQLDNWVWCRDRQGEDRERCRNWAGRINLGTGTNDAFFCSELVVAAFQSAGVPLTSTPPHWTSPEDLAEMRLSNRLGYVGHLKTP
jgi:uncharacterized protein YycO